MAGQDATDTQRLRDLEAMLDSITDYKVIKLGPDGNIATWNRGGELLTGYSAAEVIGQHVSIFYTEEDKRSGLAEGSIGVALPKKLSS